MSKVAGIYKNTRVLEAKAKRAEAEANTAVDVETFLKCKNKCKTLEDENADLCKKIEDLENKVKELLIRRKATTEDVLRVIEFCKKFIESSKVDEMNKLQLEIDRLTELKRTLENN